MTDRSRRRVAVVALAYPVLAVGCGSAGVEPLPVTGVWARMTPSGAVNGVVYLTIDSTVRIR